MCGLVLLLYITGQKALRRRDARSCALLCSFRLQRGSMSCLAARGGDMGFGSDEVMGACLVRFREKSWK